jgi:hypothetical protein
MHMQVQDVSSLHSSLHALPPSPCTCPPIAADLAANGRPKPGGPAGGLREPRRCAGCGERDWRAAGQLKVKCCLRRTARLGRAGQPRLFCCRAPDVAEPSGYQPSANALALTLVSSAVRQVGLRDWLRLHGRLHP